MIALYSILAAAVFTLPGGPGPDDREELAKLQGVWHVTVGEENGERVPKARREKAKLTITGARFKLEDGTTAIEGSFSVGSDFRMKTFDAFAELSGNETTPAIGIYKIEKETLTLCFSKGKRRPGEFKTEAGQNTSMIIADRQKTERAPD